jgi:hypothetical protein
VLQDGVTGPVIAERDELKAKLAAAEAGLRDAHSSLEGAEEERKQLTWRVRRLDEKLLAKDKCAPVLPCFALLVWHLRRAVKFAVATCTVLTSILNCVSLYSCPAAPCCDVISGGFHCTGERCSIVPAAE